MTAWRPADRAAMAGKDQASEIPTRHVAPDYFACGSHSIRETLKELASRLA